jgi:hypothetical protein
VEQLPKLDGKKMFLYLAPKKTGVVKKSQQKMDREKRPPLHAIGWQKKATTKRWALVQWDA